MVIADGKRSVTVLLDDEIVVKLDELADVLKWSRTRLVNELLLEAVSDNEKFIRLGAKVARGLERLSEMNKAIQQDFFRSEKA